MKKRILSQSSGYKVSALGLGCMGMSEFYGATDKAQSVNTIRFAYESGVDFFDTADMYGKGENETLIGEAVRPFRNDITLATKCGIVRDPDGPNTMGLNGSYEYITQACAASLKRLGVDYIDLYYLHRVDPNTPIEESMRALSDLVEHGKIRFIGLSEVNAETLRKAHQIHPITAVQTEYSLTVKRTAEEILPVCRELGVTFIPYSPIARGLLSGKYINKNELSQNDWRRELPQFQDEHLPQNLEFINGLENLAKIKNCSAAQISLAWLLAQGDDIISIPGTRQTKHLSENIASLYIDLSQEDLAYIDKLCVDKPVLGERLPKALMEKFKLEY
jgi:aryl-alcohol dehydrogenase-like predicted oxidoreductase